MSVLTRTHLLRAIGVLLALSFLTAPAALAADQPTIATPQSYRYHADIAITIGESRATGTADGEIDLVRQAFRLTVVATEDGQQVRQELILIDNRLYIYNEQRQRWEYLDLVPDEGPTGLPETTLPPLELPRHPAAAYEPLGTAQIDGATTNRWRAAGPFNQLVAFVSPREFGGLFIEETLTVEVAIGAANNYLYQMTIKEAGTVSEVGETTSTFRTATSDLAYAFKDFDQPLAITAPPNAVPLPDEPGDFLRDTGTPLARALRHPDKVGLTSGLYPLIPTLLPRP